MSTLILTSEQKYTIAALDLAPLTELEDGAVICVEIEDPDAKFVIDRWGHMDLYRGETQT